MPAADAGEAGEAPVARQLKRQKVSVADFFDDSESEEDTHDAALDELAEYLALPQASSKVKPTEWWLEHKDTFPNLEVMARQYLGCPASSLHQ